MKKQTIHSGKGQADFILTLNKLEVGTLSYADNVGSPDKPGGLSIQLCKSEKKEFYIRYSS